MAEVRLEGVCKDFGKTAAVTDLNLTVHDREFLTLIGPSGCGKSTTLRMICGLDRASSGQIYFEGQPVGWLPANKRDVAMVFQSYALYPHKTVEQNIGFALRVMGVPKDEARLRVQETAQMLGITELLDRKPKELSGGQRQRVALGRVMVRDAGAYLLDEPLSNLDAQLRVSMRAELKRLHSDLQRTFIYVTHDQVEAMTMSDRIAVLKEGQLQQCGSPEDIYERPANMFVASFMGSPPMNFIHGTLTAAGTGKVAFTYEADSYVLPDGHSLPTENLDSVVLGIRPEDVQLSLTPEPDHQPGEIFVTEPLGPDVLVTVQVQGALIKARVPAPFRVAKDSAIYLRIVPSKIHLFAESDGRALLAPSPA